MSPALSFHRIVSLQDEGYDDWLNLYQQSFPLNEQMLVGSLNKMLRGGEEGGVATTFLLVRDESGAAVGMALYESAAKCGCAALWYLAVRSDVRSRGLGGATYREIVSRVRAASSEIKALVYEVELPETAEEDSVRALAVRRIEFYRRNGAKLVGGLHYVQSVGWQEPVPMHLMIHPFAELSPEQALEMLQCKLGEEVKHVGQITLS